MILDEAVRRQWRADLDPKIQAVRELARTYRAHLLAADGLFAGLAATTGPEHWTADGVHPTPAGHAALAEAWLRLVAGPGLTAARDTGRSACGLQPYEAPALGTDSSRRNRSG
ncbi:hypothetical protein [Kitasatospora sp. NPDC050543]|uniref:hypothetical protein n=1 Tax=Kitasatospora sp. NPDC050543 TaxID=3364054 RepID=UPI0037A5CAB4